jgi:hypothetical protein
MRNKPRQLRLRLTSQCPVALTAQTERELIEALSEMLLAVASVDEARKQVEGDRGDEQQDQ